MSAKCPISCFFWVVLATAAWATACGDSGPRTDSETHWLSACDSNADCDGLYSCHCGYCTVGCSATADCTDADLAGVCVSVGGLVCGSGTSDGPENICMPPCESQADCSRWGADLVCLDGLCQREPHVDFLDLDRDAGDGAPDVDDHDPVDDAPAEDGGDLVDAVEEASGDASDTADTDSTDWIYCGGFAGLECPETMYCEFPDDLCGGADGMGVCLPRPESCPDEGDPVCACNRELYANACLARQAGYDLARINRCDPPEDRFACGTVFCQRGESYCEQTPRPEPFTDLMSCRPLPEECLPSPTCECLADEPCGASCEETDGGFQLTCDVLYEDRFAGIWVVDQPTHALYEATVYHFHDDGTLEGLRTAGYDTPPYPDYVTGTVAECFGEDCVSCRFGDTWWSPNRQTLAILGDCSDGWPRDIVLGFPEDESQDGLGVGVTILSVRDETGWIHPDFDWRFFKCEGQVDCLEF